MLGRRSSAVLAVLAGLLALTLAWVLAPARAPLYDGVGFPDEPYRYVVPPASAKPTKPPGTARAAVPMAGGRSTQAAYALSDESGPQVSVYVPAGALHGPTGTSTAELVAAPAAPDPSTTQMTTDGNVYRVQVAGGSGFSYAASGSGAGTIVLRQTSPGESPPTVVYRSGAGKQWRTLPTQKAGNDIYRANLAGLGDYAMAYVAAGGLKADGGGIPVQAIVLGVVVVLLAGGLLSIRVTRLRASA